MELASLRRAGAALLAAFTFCAQAVEGGHLPAHAMNADELSQVHAGGLPETLALQAGGVLALQPPGHDRRVDDAALQAQAALLERQQALAQARIAAGATQGMVNLTQTVAFAGAFTPVAPLLIPVMMPFPFMPVPPQDNGKH